MDCRLLILPLVPVMAAAPAAYATTYLTIEQAQALMYPGQALTQSFVALTPEQQKAVLDDSGSPAGSPVVRAWHTDSHEWFLVDQVYGRHQLITYAVALDAQGTVRRLEVLEYLESYGGEVRNSGWRDQFRGKHHGDAVRVGDDIQNISGATLSSRHLTEGMRRLLSTYALVLAPATPDADHAAH